MARERLEKLAVVAAERRDVADSVRDEQHAERALVVTQRRDNRVVESALRQVRIDGMRLAPAWQQHRAFALDRRLDRGERDVRERDRIHQYFGVCADDAAQRLLTGRSAE